MSATPEHPISTDGRGAHSLHRLVGARPYYVVNWENSCDWCKHQEGRHYCLLHGEPMKNMDLKRCDQWEDRPNAELRHGAKTPDV